MKKQAEDGEHAREEELERQVAEQRRRTRKDAWIDGLLMEPQERAEHEKNESADERQRKQAKKDAWIDRLLGEPAEEAEPLDGPRTAEARIAALEQEKAALKQQLEAAAKARERQGDHLAKLHEAQRERGEQQRALAILAVANVAATAMAHQQHQTIAELRAALRMHTEAATDKPGARPPKWAEEANPPRRCSE